MFDSELLVLLLGSDTSRPAGELVADEAVAARVTAAVEAGGWRRAADGVSQLMDVVDEDGHRLMMLVVSVSAVAGVRAAAADLAGSGVFPFFTDGQVADVPDEEFFTLATRFGVPVLVDSWGHSLVEQMLAAAGGAR